MLSSTVRSIQCYLDDDISFGRRDLDDPGSGLRWNRERGAILVSGTILPANGIVSSPRIIWGRDDHGKAGERSPWSSFFDKQIPMQPICSARE